MKRVTASLIGLLIASPILAQEPVQREHVVKDGDTLWDLAGFYYEDPFRWPRIYDANTTVVEDPHWIYPNEVLVIPGIAGDTEPQVAIRRASPPPPMRTVFYRPPPERPNRNGDPTVLSRAAFEPPPVPAGEFYAAPWVGDPDDLEPVGEFIRALRENRAVGGAPSAHPRDRIFLRHSSDVRPEIGERLLLVGVGDRVPGTPRGTRLLEPTGFVVIESMNDDGMIGNIESQFTEIYRGQVAIRLPMYPDFRFTEAQPIEGGGDLEGRILHFMDEPLMPSRSDVGFVNLGSADGVHVGDLLTAYLPERAAREREVGEFGGIERLPREDVAVLRVVQVGDRVATVRVESVFLPRLERGTLVRRSHAIN